MGKLIVIPPPETASARAAANDEARPARPRARLDERRLGLQAFAERATAGETVLGAALPSGSASRRPRYKILEGIGALLLDEEDVDRRRLEESLGAVVLENGPAACPASASAGVKSKSPEPNFWHLEKINVGALRDRGVTGAGVAVGVLDSGVEGSHPEFAGKKIHFAHFDRDGNQIDAAPKDFGYHGTHVAGLIAGRNAGVAPDAVLAVAAVLTEKRGHACHHAAILAGLDWLIKTDFLDTPDEPGCSVINSSLQIKGFNNFLYNFLATAGVAPGSLLIAAAGNFGWVNPGQPTTPGNYDIVVGVGATDADDRVALFSQWGVVKESGGVAKPDLCAPGVDIWSSSPSGGYNKMSGTSMASPLACGAAALLLQQQPALARDARRLKEALLRHTLPLPAEGPKAGRGRLQLGR